MTSTTTSTTVLRYCGTYLYLQRADLAVTGGFQAIGISQSTLESSDFISVLVTLTMLTRGRGGRGGGWW